MSTFSSQNAIYEDFVSVDKTVYNETAIKNSITNILLTRIGSMPGRPTFGSRVHEIPFSPNDVVTKTILKKVISEALARWEHRIIFNDVVIESNEANNLKAQVQFKYKDTGLLGAVSVQLLG